mgnify:CR=1 FL=1
MKNKSFFDLQDDIDRLKYYDDQYEKRCGIKPNQIKGYDPKVSFLPKSTFLNDIVAIIVIMTFIHIVASIFR